MLVWGGSGRYGQLLPNNIINVYNLTKRSWSIRKTISSPEDTPPLCEFAGSASTPSGRFVYQFGGTRVDYEGQLDYFNNLHVLDTEEFVWKQVCVGSGRRPSPRSLAGMCILGSRLLLFGGLGRRIPNPVPRAEWKEWIMSGKCLNKGWNNELWEISTDNETVSSLSWEPVCCAGDMPKARCDHSFTAVQSSRALLYGGFGSFGHMDDLALFNYEEKAWSSLNLPVQLYRPFCRGEYAAAAVDVPNQGKRIIFLWGCNEKYDIVNDGFALEFVGGEVKECHILSFPSSVVAARVSSVCSVLQSPTRMFFLLFGGSPHSMFSSMDRAECQLTVLQWNFQHSMELQCVSDAEDIIPSEHMPGSSSLSEVLPVPSAFAQEENQNVPVLSRAEDQLSSENLPKSKKIPDQKAAPAECTELSFSNGDLPSDISVNFFGMVLNFERNPELDFSDTLDVSGGRVSSDGSSTCIIIPRGAIPKGAIPKDKVTIGGFMYSLDKKSSFGLDEFTVVSDLIALRPCGFIFEHPVTVLLDHGIPIQINDDFVATVMHQSGNSSEFVPSEDIREVGGGVAIGHDVHATLSGDVLRMTRNHFCKAFIGGRFKRRCPGHRFKCLVYEEKLEDCLWQLNIIFCSRHRKDVLKIKKKYGMSPTEKPVRLYLAKDAITRVKIEEPSGWKSSRSCPYPLTTDYLHNARKNPSNVFPFPVTFTRCPSTIAVGTQDQQQQTLAVIRIESFERSATQPVSYQIDVLPTKEVRCFRQTSSPVCPPVNPVRRQALRQTLARQPDNREIEELLPLIAHEWKDVIRCLEPPIPESEIVVLAREQHRGPASLAGSALVTWMGRYGAEASVFALCDALKASDMGRCAEQVFHVPVIEND
eukprot:m.70209 g.70209  ORF g.70209 m.70209 type:complete len:871 (+) comp35666_c1_seq6:437-3049(+)